MSDGLFNPEAFEQVPGQISMEQVEPVAKCWEQGESLVFRPVDSEPERSGQWWSEEPTCGVTVFGWADGRRYWVAHRNIRPESDHERYMREQQGYYVEQLS